MVDKKKESVKHAPLKIKKQYTPAQRRKLLQQYHDHRKDGKTAAQAAELVNVAYMTLHTWEKAPEKRSNKGAKSKVYAAPATGGKIVIYFPNGCRADCQTVQDAAQLLTLLP